MVDVEGDVEGVQKGDYTYDDILSVCLITDAAPEHAEGWRDYAATIVAKASEEFVWFNDGDAPSQRSLAIARGGRLLRITAGPLRGQTVIEVASDPPDDPDADYVPVMQVYTMSDWTRALPPSLAFDKEGDLCWYRADGTLGSKFVSFEEVSAVGPIEAIVAAERWKGTEAQCDAVIKFALSYRWDGPMMDPGVAVSLLTSEIARRTKSFHPRAAALLEAALLTSAIKYAALLVAF